jgi:5-hydroxyisourate hydrolase-like protein (transthyretin family)
MFKNLLKSLLLLLLLSSSINALEVQTEYRGYNSAIVLHFDTGNYEKQAGKIKKNWVGIYKAGTSNAWENVIQWAWVKDMEKPKYSNRKIRVLKLDKLNAGDYEIRFFVDNSYDTFASSEFLISDQDSLLSLYQKSQNNIEVVIRDINLLAEDTWIAIFKKDDVSERENIIDWKWCRFGGPGSEHFHFKTFNYKSGDYEIRLFLNGSYDLEDSLKFTVNNGAEIPKLSISSRFANVIYFNATHEADGESWIGFFEKGATSNRANLKNWAWVTTDATPIEIEDMEDGKYDVRLFYKNSYEVKAELEIELGRNPFIDTPFSVNENYTLLKIRFMYGVPSNATDWLAIFKKDAKRIKENILSWVYVGDKRDALNVRYVFIKVGDLPNGEYDLVFFENDSYKQYGITGKIILDR